MPWTAARQASLPLTVSQFAQVHVHWISDAIQPSHPLACNQYSSFHLIIKLLKIYYQVLKLHVLKHIFS